MLSSARHQSTPLRAADNIWFVISAQHRGQNRPARSALILLLGMLAALVSVVPMCAQAPDFESLSARAAQARDAGDAAQAVELYRQATALKPNWQEGWWYLGVLQYGANQYSAAIDAFSHVLQIQPKAVPAMALRGLCEFEIAAYDDALRDLDEAVAHGAANDPRNEQILRYHLGQLLTRAERYREALDQYTFFAKEGIDNPDLDAAIGMAGMLTPRLVSDLPAQSRALYEAGGQAAYPLLAGDSTVASQRFAALFAQYPNTPNLHFFYGYLLFPNDTSDLTIDQFQRELAVNPSNGMAQAYLAFTFMIAGQYKEAQQALAGATGGEVSQDIADVVMGRLLAETGEAARGEALLKQVLEHDPNNMEAHLGLASIYSHQGRREDARRERMACLRLEK